jgi:hypothetical protein
VTVQGTTTGTPGNYTYEAGWGIYGLINNGLSSTPQNWSFTFGYTEFGNGDGTSSTAIPIWAEEYDGLGNLISSDNKSVTLTN